MLVSHVMTRPVVTVSSSTPVLEAAKLMKDSNVQRLPVVDKGRLVGVVTSDRALRASPSGVSNLSLQEIHYLFAKLTVGEIMQRDPVTVSPDTTVESAVQLAQERRVGCLPVVENGEVIGILTTNDFFYLVLNPLLGIGEGGSRVIVRHCSSPETMVTALQCVGELGHQVLNAAYLPSRRGNERDFMIHIDAESAAELIRRMQTQGLEAEERERYAGGGRAS